MLTIFRMYENQQVFDWLDACNRAARQPASSPPTFQQQNAFRGTQTPLCRRSPRHQPYKMSNATDPQVDELASRHQRKFANSQPSRKQPQRASLKPQAAVTQRVWASTFPPPMTDTQFDPITDISTSSPSRSDTVASTQITSVSRNHSDVSFRLGQEHDRGVRSRRLWI